MHSVLILLSTYNGDKYLREQLDSILAQKGVDVHILVRDDGSRDLTIDIIEEYIDHYPNKIYFEKGRNVGCLNSFMNLLRIAAEQYPEYDYYAFADQDDVWFEDKLYNAAEALSKSDDLYKLYFCPHQLVDADLKRLPTKRIKYKLTLAEAFVFQPCIGCSMVFNYALLKEASRADSSMLDIHDAWLYKLALSLGANVICGDKVGMFYRQHSSNTIGSHQSIVSTWKRRWNWFVGSKRYRSSIARYILDNYGALIPSRQRQVIENISNYCHSTKTKFRILFSSDYSTSKKLHSFFFKIAIITNRI